ncbi:hypothetical protein CERSUDRAFT_92742 [Gelatoporia subvermispora B]|uniref:Uncharacterized protein n=1 Tax=Ceriporiopsis subvermispora (strain B) TaxID=914234 RepID=M2QT75_CERS8|nr:hypothetical protein CERSUDRAFT_92742 [Gelatoporia subvermispora B]
MSPNFMSNHDEAPHTRVSHPGDPRDTHVASDKADYREENLPDGEEVLQEWKEGPDKVIEKRSAPGEDVEVEVQKNAYPNGKSPVRLFSPDAHRMEELVEQAGRKVKAKCTGKGSTHREKDSEHH